MPQASRTLLRSPPELWAEVGHPAALARLLHCLGAVRIVGTRPERYVEWTSERGGGVIHLEPAGFGTRVTVSTEAARVEELEDGLAALGLDHHRPFSRS